MDPRILDASLSARASGALESARALAARGSEVSPGEAAREFEALLVGQLLKDATRPLMEDAPLGGGPGARLYQELFLEEVVRRSDGRFGFAAAIERELGRGRSQEPQP